MQRLQLFRVATLILTASSLTLAFMSSSAAQNSHLVYFGTYTGEKSKGIYLSRFDLSSGKLEPPQLAAETKNPSFLAIHPNGRWLYAAGEIGGGGGKPEGKVSAFKLDEQSGQLALINEQGSGGSGPCHVAVDKTGKYVLVANYGSGSIAALPLEPDGRLGPASQTVQHHGSGLNPQRQEGPHAHFITTDPANKFVLTCDLGLDKVLIYHFDPPTTLLTPTVPPGVSLKPGSGPRHLAFHPNGRYVYVINELSSSLTAFSYDGHSGVLKELETRSTLPPEFKGQNTCAEVQVHPSGRFVYGSNRGHNSIAVFEVNPKDGRINRLECVASGGKAPRHFAVDPSGKWLLSENQDSDNVIVFAVDPNSGRLSPSGNKIEVGSPVCVLFVP